MFFFSNHQWLGWYRQSGGFMYRLCLMMRIFFVHTGSIPRFSYGYFCQNRVQNCIHYLADDCNWRLFAEDNWNPSSFFWKHLWTRNHALIIAINNSCQLQNKCNENNQNENDVDQPWVLCVPYFIVYIKGDVRIINSHLFFFFCWAFSSSFLGIFQVVNPLVDWGMPNLLASESLSTSDLEIRCAQILAARAYFAQDKLACSEVPFLSKQFGGDNPWNSF